MKPLAVIRKCMEDKGEHSYQDFCLACAPYWYNIPACSICNRKLSQKGYCSQCKKYHDMQSYIDYKD